MSLTYFIEKGFNWEEGSVKEFVNQEGKLKVKLVVMDLSSLFRRVVQTMFPCAAIIMGDRFHIKRLVIRAQERVRKKVQNHFREKRI
ncbi:transposase [Megasphaera sp.]|uniref:transposase n=1 Tax=Megasphaera sp. TaxID=2023260 RepID=UPI0027BA37D1|nr:transposase [Megasphaera sp.]